MEKQGYQWKDFAVAGGGGAAAMTALKTQVISGNAPTAAQIKGPLIQEWASQDVLVNIDKVASDWKANLPPGLDAQANSDGHYVAVPFSIHRINWLWINKADLDKAGGKAPTTWPEFFALADKFRAAGITAVAHGGQPWQDMTIWETVVLSQGAEFYRKALVDLDQKTLTSPQMVQVFDIVRKIRSYFGTGYQSRDWNLATAMVLSGTAACNSWATGQKASSPMPISRPISTMFVPRLLARPMHLRTRSTRSFSFSFTARRTHRPDNSRWRKPSCRPTSSAISACTRVRFQCG
jgi:glucose/mannose transport system substrate-binding protein